MLLQGDSKYWGMSQTYGEATVRPSKSPIISYFRN